MRIEELDAVDVGVPGIVMRALAPGVQDEQVRVDLAVLEPGTSLPRHPAGRDQLFVVVAGRGRVAGDDDQQVEVGPGAAVRWTRGEQPGRTRG